MRTPSACTERTPEACLERGEVNLSFDNLVRVATGLGVPLWALFLVAEDLLVSEKPAAENPGEPSGCRGPELVGAHSATRVFRSPSACALCRARPHTR